MKRQICCFYLIFQEVFIKNEKNNSNFFIFNFSGYELFFMRRQQLR